MGTCFLFYTHSASGQKSSHSPNAQSSENKNNTEDSFIKMEPVFINNKKVRLQSMGLEDYPNLEKEIGIKGFNALVIFENQLGSEFWKTENESCLTVKKIYSSATKDSCILELSWDKISGNCNWVGMGFGWDNWQPKNITPIIESAQIQIRVKSLGDTLTSLPLAFGLEDYTGEQAYVGFKKTYISEPITANGWSLVKIPFKDFPFKEFNSNTSMIKQLIVQLEAEGTMVIKDIRITPTNP